MSLLYSARDARLARASRVTRESTNDRRQMRHKIVMTVQAEKKPSTKEIYFLQAPVGNSFCEHLIKNKNNKKVLTEQTVLTN